MSTIVLRSVKGSPLTNTEVDNNFTNLNNDKLQVGGTYSAGTANGVLFLSASKVLTTGSALTFDGTNFGVGTAPVSGYKAAINGDFWQGNGSGNVIGTITNNAGWYDFGGSTNVNGVQMSHASTARWLINGSEQMRLTSTGLGIGTSSPGAKLVAAAASPIIASRGTAYLYSTNSMAANLGGQLSFGGSYTGTTETIFGAIAGRKETGTDNDIGGYLQFSTTNVSLGPVERMRLDSSGNLGLGVTPSAWNTNYKAIQNGQSGWMSRAGGSDFYLFANSYQEAASPFAFKYINTAPASRYQQDAGAHSWFTAPSGTAGNAITFTQAMTLDASGNLMLGTTSPTGRLSVVGDYAFFRENSSGADVYIRGYYGGADVAAIQVATNSPLAFATNNTERARIDASGNFFVNATAIANNKNYFVYSPGNAFAEFSHENGVASGVAYVNFRYNGTVIANITQSGTTAVAYNTTSDYRLKTVAGAVTGHGERIDALEPIEYTWNTDGSQARGFLAHKFQEVYPLSVTGSKDAVDAEGKPVYQAMQAGSSEVIADLVAEIKSLRQRLAVLEAK
jgi:hypothetical protein